MESKITHYVVKPEHLRHYQMLVGAQFFNFKTDRPSQDEFGPDSVIAGALTQAKVLDLWCTPVREKPRVKGWYNVYPSDHILAGPKETKEEAINDAGGSSKCIGQIFIDKEIE